MPICPYLTVWRHIGTVALLTFCRQPSRQRVVDRVRAGVGTGVVPAAGTTTAGVDRSSVDGGRRGSIRSTTNLAWKRRAAGTLRSDSASGAASRQPTSASSTPARTVRLVAEMVEPAITRRRLGDWKHSTLHSLTRREAANTSRRPEKRNATTVYRLGSSPQKVNIRVLRRDRHHTQHGCTVPPCTRTWAEEHPAVATKLRTERRNFSSASGFQAVAAIAESITMLVHSIVSPVHNVPVAKVYVLQLHHSPLGHHGGGHDYEDRLPRPQICNTCH
uniref:Uncharacterized protein n=1 Tax=Anopheles coluzzii TaxID=1518534 RepID=A0A8W7PZ20_ANOCL